MRAASAAGARPVLRAAAAGVLATLLALLVLLRGLSGLLEPDTTDLVLTAYGALVVFVAAAVGGATGAWQAAAAGASTRRAIVVVGAAATALGCVTASVVLAVAESVEAGRALVELVAIVTGASSGAWAFPRAVLAAASLRGDRGQSVVEYVEYEGAANPRGAVHRARILANDPGALFELRIVP